MSWIPNPFKSLQLYDDDDSLSEAGDDATGGSVSEDLSVIGETIGRQLRGVAAFLAPPPASSSSTMSSSSSAVATAVADDSGDSMSPTFARIRRDLAEVGGSFKSSLSLLSNTKAVSEFSKITSNFFQLDDVEEEDESEDDRGVGITDAVLRFVAEISQRPEFWTDFPMSLNHGFTMTQDQAEHVAVIVDLVPSLAELRVRLSSEMSGNRFWMIYFILLLPRLNRDSVDLLSTPEIVETRSALLNMMLNKRNSPTSDSQKDHIDISSQSDSKLDQDRHDPNSSGEKAEVAEKVEPSRDEEPQETNRKRSEEADARAASVDSQRQFKNEDDFSFSDLEDDDTDLSTRHRGSGRAQDAVSSSPEASSEWVRLNKNAETEGGKSKEEQLSSKNRESEGESSDWLTIDEFDDN